MTPAKKILTAFCAVALCASLTACQQKQPRRPATITTVDKELSCQDLQLEMNDAEYIRQMAIQNKGLNTRNILWPFGMPTTYMNAAEAEESANARLAYLQKVYMIKECKQPLY